MSHVRPPSPTYLPASYQFLRCGGLSSNRRETPVAAGGVARFPIPYVATNVGHRTRTRYTHKSSYLLSIVHHTYTVVYKLHPLALTCMRSLPDAPKRRLTVQYQCIIYRSRIPGTIHGAVGIYTVPSTCSCIRYCPLYGTVLYIPRIYILVSYWYE